MVTLPKHECRPECRCPKCDPTMAAVMRMPTDQYARWLQATTVGMLATAPKGPGIIPAQYRAMADYEPAPVHSQPARPSAPTPLAEIREGVARVKREIAAEREGREVLRRLRNEIARDFRYLMRVPVTDGYTEALTRQHGPEPELDIYRDGPVPDPYTLKLGEIVAKRADGTPVRLPGGDDPPDGYTLALEAMRRRTAKHDGN